jgi:hypothetical protein
MLTRLAEAQPNKPTLMAASMHIIRLVIFTVAPLDIAAHPFFGLKNAFY